jgi:hypothetical protein
MLLFWCRVRRHPLIGSARHSAFATLLTSIEYPIRLGRQTRKIPHSLRPCRETRPCDLSLQTNPLKPTASSLPIYDKTICPFPIGEVAWSFTKKTTMEKDFFGKAFRVRHHLSSSLLAGFSLRPKRGHPLFEIVAVFYFPAFSGGIFLFAAFRLYTSRRVLTKSPPSLQREYIMKKEGYSILFIKRILLCPSSLPTHTTS